MKRSLEQALLDLRQHISAWAQGGAKPGIYIFVYPPEWEAPMLTRLPGFVADCAAAGWPVELVDVGQGFARELERRKGLIEQLAAQEAEGAERLRHDLGIFGERYLARALRARPQAPTVARLFVNTGALATFASYSAILSALSGEELPAPTVFAFPGEDDERSLNLLGLRADTNYRLPRI
ncbi:MAG: hypothetical protein M1370_07175 [Bacteroidetes bacterium]|nr:hypothetical protein [Bacteroidota bacterium]